MSFEDNRFCVYLHRRKDTGEVFYVGSGTKARPFARRRNNLRWQKIADSVGFTVEVVGDSLTKQDSLTMETEFIATHRETIVNRLAASSCVKEMLYEDFVGHLQVDPQSPSGLVWGRNVCNGQNGLRIQRRIGDPAGSVDRSGYFVVKIGNRAYKAHRIVYLLTNGKLLTTEVVDHIDGNVRNNHPSNLRAVSHKINACNTRRGVISSTGTVGVYFDKRRGGSYRGLISQSENTKQPRLSKSFSCKKYGKEQALQLAIEWRKQKEKEHGFNPDCTN